MEPDVAKTRVDSLDSVVKVDAEEWVFFTKLAGLVITVLGLARRAADIV